jgi:hypothetical protein
MKKHNVMNRRKVALDSLMKQAEFLGREDSNNPELKRIKKEIIILEEKINHGT